MTMYSSKAGMLAALLALAGCAVGPQYEPLPIAPIALHSPQAANHAGVPADSVAAQWWTLFDDPVLAQWVDAALIHNHDIRQAQANLLAARAVFDERQWDRVPGVTASAGYQRGSQQQFDEHGKPARTLSESWRAGFDMQWEIDVFRRLERLSQAAQARAQASEAELELMRLSIAAEVARSYFDAQGLMRRLAVAQQQVGNWRETVQLIDAHRRAGSGLPEDLENARSQLMRSEADIAPLTAALQQARMRLDVLTGQRPGQGELTVPPPSAQPFSRQLPLGDVDALIRNRPDVRRAERQWAASVHDVAAATAELYPRFDLGGFIGFFALRGADFGHAATRAFDLAPGATWPALRLGNARARLRGTQALSQGAQAQYEQALLQAQEEVENAVVSLTEHQRYMGSLMQSADHAERAFDIARKRYQAGSGSYLSVLENQRELFRLKQDVAQAEMASHFYVVALYKALGWGTA